MAKTKLITIIVILAVVLAAIPVFTGCSKLAPYADPMTENILNAIAEEDYASFSKDFDDVMKKELPEEVFPEFLATINGAIGNYIKDSKSITGVNIENNLTTATYLADFESKEAVTVRVIFQKIDDVMKIVGLWFE